MGGGALFPRGDRKLPRQVLPGKLEIAGERGPGENEKE